MPTICSSCGRTSGKCQSCIKVDKLLTPERIADIQEAAEAEWLGAGGGSNQLFMTTLARAISREVVAILAGPSAEAEFEILVDDEWVAGASGPRERAMAEAMHYAVQYAEDGQVTIFEVTRRQLTTPAASGIGESGGE